MRLLVADWRSLAHRSHDALAAAGLDARRPREGFVRFVARDVRPLVG